MLFSNIGNLMESGSLLNVEPISEAQIAHITPDGDGLHQIVLESQQETMRIEKAVVLAEQKILEQEAMGSGNLQALQEAVIGDVFKKIVEKIKELYRKVVAFFKKLFASISVSCGDISKSLDKSKEYLKGDFSKYEYTMIPWKSSNNIATVISDNLKASITDLNNITNTIEKIANDVNENGISLSKNDNTKTLSVEEVFGDLLNKNESISREEATEIIKEAYAESQTPEKKKGLSNVSEMVDFLKNFKKNKTLNDLKTKTEKEFSEAVKLAQKIQNKVKGLESKAKGETATNLSKVVKVAKANLDSINNALSGYSILMGVCINMEKKKFSDYRRIISGAVRYKGGKSSDDDE